MLILMSAWLIIILCAATSNFYKIMCMHVNASAMIDACALMQCNLMQAAALTLVHPNSYAILSATHTHASQ